MIFLLQIYCDLYLPLKGKQKLLSIVFGDFYKTPHDTLPFTPIGDHVEITPSVGGPFFNKNFFLIADDKMLFLKNVIHSTPIAFKASFHILEYIM